MAIVSFTKAYVLKTTVAHMLRSVDFSITKTSERWPEFVDDPEKSREIMDTLLMLQGIRRQVIGISKANTTPIKED